MRFVSRSAFAFGLLAAAGSPSLPVAAESLGNASADAVVAALRAKAPDRPLACRLRDDGMVFCTGARTGDCVDEGWLLSHDGEECRKKFE